MLLYVVRLYHQGRRLSEPELRAAQGVQGDVHTHFDRFADGRSLHKAVCLDGSREALPALMEPQLTGISSLSLGLEGYEEARTADGTVFHRQVWWCRFRVPGSDEQT
jgi:hypothetical protein